MPNDTKQRLIETGLKRFYRDGFRNVGLDQILADVGISKTAFYKHFECKEDLMIAVLQTQEAWMQETFRSMVRERGGDDPQRRLRALFDVVATISESADFKGCIFVNASIEFPLQHEPAHQAAAKGKETMEEIVTELAAECGAEDPTALAQELCLIMEGAYVTRQISGKPQSIDIARRAADVVIRAHLDGVGRGK